MKKLLVLSLSLILVASATFQWNLEDELEEAGGFLANSLNSDFRAANALVNLADKAVELTVKLTVKVWKIILRKKEPVEIANKDKWKFEWEDVKGTLKYMNFTLVNPSQGELKKVQSQVSKKLLDLTFFYSQFKLDNIHYSCRVTYKEWIKFKGKGLIKANFTDLLLNFKATYSMENKKVICKTLFMNYVFKDVKVNITGLKVPKILKNDFDEALNKGVTAYLKAFEPEISKKIATKIQKKINDLNNFEENVNEANVNEHQENEEFPDENFMFKLFSNAMKMLNDGELNE